MSVTGRWVRNDSPQSPCTKSPSQCDVLRGTGLVEVVLVLEVAQRLLRDRRAGAAAPAAGRRAPRPAANTTIVASSDDDHRGRARRRTTKRDHRDSF